MRYVTLLLSVIVLLLVVSGCREKGYSEASTVHVRQLVDTVGFAQYPWQLDSIMARIIRNGWKRSEAGPWKLAVCPHDDYTYAGELYPELLQNVVAPTLILIGVAHKAARLGIEDSLVFDSYSFWKGPWSNIPVSPARKEIFELIDENFATLSDTLHQVEHSLEAMIPFLQYFNRNVSVVPVLVPAMDPARMEACGHALAEAIRSVASTHGWEWGRDYAIIVTTDAVHYGNEDWGGADYAFFGCDTAGNRKALDHEAEIIEKCLVGSVAREKIRLFNSYTLNQDNYKEYKWTWCGRYCIPVAIYASYFLNGSEPLRGELCGYVTSITSKHIPVDDLNMGRTAIATQCHWVGYAAIGYK
jgi:AmmeMemoRadiSam system protein B